MITPRNNTAASPDEEAFGKELERFLTSCPLDERLETIERGELTREQIIRFLAHKRTTN